MPKKRDLWVVALILLLAVVLLAAQQMMRGSGKDLDAYVPEATMAPGAVEEISVTPQAAKEAQHVGGAIAGPTRPEDLDGQGDILGYVILGVQGKQYGDPIPMNGDKVITLKQDDAHINEVYITRTSVEMRMATCENQDCVQQGVITTENYKERVLGAYIMCLPNQVTIEFIATEQLEGTGK